MSVCQVMTYTFMLCFYIFSKISLLSIFFCKGLNAECLENDDCMVDDSLCATTSASNGTQDQSKTCQCRKGFVHFKDECLKEGTESVFKLLKILQEKSFNGLLFS